MPPVVPKSPLSISILLTSTWLGSTACDEDALFRQPDPPNTPDASETEAPLPPPVDAGATIDAGPSVPLVEPATEPVYIHTGDTLYSYDPSSNRAGVIGMFRSGSRAITSMVDIAIDLGGRMYGGTREQEIFLIDPETARCTFLSGYADKLHGLTFLPDGRLVVAGDRVSIMDPWTGDMLLELVPMGTYATSGDIIGLPDGQLYWTVRRDWDQNEGDGLVRIDPRTGTTTWLGDGSVNRIFGLGYAANILYGFSSNGVAVVLDRQSGSVMEAQRLDGRWWGATTNPVLWDQ